MNALPKVFHNFQAMNYFKVWLLFPYHSICKKRRCDTHNIIKVLVFLDFILEISMQKFKM